MVENWEIPSPSGTQNGKKAIISPCLLAPGLAESTADFCTGRGKKGRNLMIWVHFSLGFSVSVTPSIGSVALLYIQVWIQSILKKKSREMKQKQNRRVRSPSTGQAIMTGGSHPGSQDMTWASIRPPVLARHGGRLCENSLTNPWP